MPPRAGGGLPALTGITVQFSALNWHVPGFTPVGGLGQSDIWDDVISTPLLDKL